jgi:hypothetical protein
MEGSFFWRKFLPDRNWANSGEADKKETMDYAHALLLNLC